MFDFLSNKKRVDVQQFLAGQMNRGYFRQFRYGDRDVARGAYCEVVWLIPVPDKSADPDYEKVFPVVTKDISERGISFVHPGELPTKYAIMGFERPVGLSFLNCLVEHTTPLGYGFHQHGLTPKELVHIDPDTVSKLQELMRKFGNPPSSTGTSFSAANQ